MNESSLQLCPVDADNWRAVKELDVFDEQREFVAETSHYLCLCAYGNVWHPLAVMLEDSAIGFLMWAYDSEEQSCWLGGIIIDKSHQRQGYGREAVKRVLEMLSETHVFSHFALTYHPQNPAKKLYAELGFVETNEWDGNEVVARLLNA